MKKKKAKKKKKAALTGAKLAKKELDDCDPRKITAEERESTGCQGFDVGICGSCMGPVVCDPGKRFGLCLSAP